MWLCPLVNLGRSCNVKSVFVEYMRGTPSSVLRYIKIGLGDASTQSSHDRGLKKPMVTHTIVEGSTKYRFADFIKSHLHGCSYCLVGVHVFTARTNWHERRIV